MLKQTWQSVLAVRLSNLNFAFRGFRSAYGHLTNQFNLSLSVCYVDGQVQEEEYGK